MRTPKKFVSELLAKGRTPDEIRCIALACRWRSQLEEIDAELPEVPVKRKRGRPPKERVD